jgi:hypothetical protein
VGVQLLQEPPPHTPLALHTSLQVLALPSLQLVPLDAVGCVQEPAEHTSLVQELPSSAQEPVLLVWVQPEAASQPSVVQTLLSSQLTVVPPQTPLVHLSLVVQALLSLHVVPFVR